MIKIVPAHLRRSAALLTFMDEEKAQAEVVWRGHSMGTWESLQPAHRMDSSGIRLVLRTRPANLVLRVSTARFTAQGAEILLSKPRGSSERVISLIWREADADSVPVLPSQRLREFLIYWVHQVSPGCQIMSNNQRSDRANALSGLYFRIHTRASGRDCIILAAGCPFSSGDNYHSALSQVLLWIALLKRRRHLSGAPGAHLLIPSGCAAVLQHRSGFLDRGKIAVEVWQYEPSEEGGVSVRRAPLPRPPIENREFRWPVLGPFHWSASLAQVLDLAPLFIKRYPRFKEYDSLRLWGLEFATAGGEMRDSISFGVGPEKTELDKSNFERLRALVDGILYYRRPDSPDLHHPYYRLQAERWLEALILEEVPRLFPELVPESVYPQIPVYLGKDPGRVDILAADREGTLVILELKVVPDPDLPIQALDYWGRVVRHNQDGDFRRRGYFSGIRLNSNPPRIYLVSPVFTFHDSTEEILMFFDSGVEVWKIAINEDWRSGVKVLRRTQLRCGDKI